MNVLLALTAQVAPRLILFCYCKYAALQVTDDQLQKAAVQSGILNIDEDFLTLEFREECERIIDTDLLKPADCKEAFLFLKRNFSL